MHYSRNDGVVLILLVLLVIARPSDRGFLTIIISITTDKAVTIPEDYVTAFAQKKVCRNPLNFCRSLIPQSLRCGKLKRERVGGTKKRSELQGQ
eukprot:1561237-Rhodomonas_salina.2